MKSTFVTMLLSIFMYIIVYGQNVGIGTTNPSKLLSVNGSIMIDQGNMNTGSIDSAALRFGTTSLVGISSNRNTQFENLHGLDFWTNGTRRMTVSSYGYVGINTLLPQYSLEVNGSAKVNHLYTDQINADGSIMSDDDVVANDDLYVGSNAYVGGNMGIGTSPSPSYKLVVSGNGLFTTNLSIDGTLRVDGKITNDGRGIMKSNSNTTLRSGFTSGTFTLSLGAGSGANFDFCIVPFTGDNDNVRVMVGQFIPGTGASATAGNVNITVIETSSSGGSCGGNYSTAKIRISNPTGSAINLGTNAKVYLYTVVTD